jgi:hypothetical protein
MAVPGHVDFFEAPLTLLLRGANGEVARDLAVRAVRVESAAKLIATTAPRVRTGRYRSSIGWRLGIDTLGLYAEIGSKVPYARILEDGSPPHEIRPRTKQALAWPGGQHPVKRVMHPGTRPYKVLARALQAAK